MLSVTPTEEEQMKTIRIQITDQERQRLLELRQKSGDYRSERALAVLHCADGRRPRQIADMLKRSSQAVCQWLHAYERDGITGLSKEYSPGRPSTRKTKLIPNLEKYLSRSPRDFGWGEDVWSVKVLMAQFEKENGFPISRYTVIRALNDEGFTAKRSKKSTPEHAPSKEEKLQRVREIANEIAKLRTTQEVEVMFLDESHFSTDPYVIRGWSKRGQPFSLATPAKREGCTIFGAYAPENDGFYWKSAKKSGNKPFRDFLHQLRAHASGKTLALILDNASIHHAKALRTFAERHPEVKFFHLAPYSPEYNPIEQVWHWLKPLVHAAKTINGGISELLSRVRKVMSARINGRLATPLNVGLGIWNLLI